MQFWTNAVQHKPSWPRLLNLKKPTKRKRLHCGFSRQQSLAKCLKRTAISIIPSYLEIILFSQKNLLTVCLVQTKNSLWARIEGVKFPMRLTTKQGQATPIQMGTVQWFSNSKGYGFIRGQDGVERFFHVTDLAGNFIPDTGASVFFKSRLDGKGPRATGIRLTEGLVSENHRQRYKNGRIPCPHCSTPIVPRMVFWSGMPIYSMCQFCGGTVKDFRQPYTPWYKSRWLINSIFFVIAVNFSALLIYKTRDPLFALYPYLAVVLLLFFRPVKLVRIALAVTASSWKKWIAGKSDGRHTPWRV